MRKSGRRQSLRRRRPSTRTHRNGRGTVRSEVGATTWRTRSAVVSAPVACSRSRKDAGFAEIANVKRTTGSTGPACSTQTSTPWGIHCIRQPKFHLVSSFARCVPTPSAVDERLSVAVCDRRPPEMIFRAPREPAALSKGAALCAVHHVSRYEGGLVSRPVAWRSDSDQRVPHRRRQGDEIVYGKSLGTNGSVAETELVMVDGDGDGVGGVRGVVGRLGESSSKCLAVPRHWGNEDLRQVCPAGWGSNGCS